MLTEKESQELQDLLNLAFEHEEIMTEEQFQRLEQLIEEDENENHTQDNS